jgi:hypothetical protein
MAATGTFFLVGCVLGYFKQNNQVCGVTHQLGIVIVVSSDLYSFDISQLPFVNINLN